VKILDYSWGRPQPFPQAILDFGASGVMRYLGPGNNGRDLTYTERDTLHAAGIPIGLIWETSANRVLDGYEAGCHDAQQANIHANQLGAPISTPIYYATDCDVSPTQTWGVIEDYYRGACGGLRPTRAYGEADVLDMLAQTFGACHGWQPAATSWSGGRISANASLLQRWPYVLGDTCDDNDVLCPNDQVDWLWGGNDMPLSQQDLNQIKQIVNDSINGALNNVYTGSRALKINGQPEVWEIVISEGDLCRRHIPRTTQQRMLQWADHLAGPKEQAPRILTDPDDIEEFEALPIAGGG
jgi:Domain of unknown function (DUF1906)